MPLPFDRHLHAEVLGGAPEEGLSLLEMPHAVLNWIEHDTTRGTEAGRMLIEILRRCNPAARPAGVSAGRIVPEDVALKIMKEGVLQLVEPPPREPLNDAERMDILGAYSLADARRLADNLTLEERACAAVRLRTVAEVAAQAGRVDALEGLCGLAGPQVFVTTGDGYSRPLAHAASEAWPDAVNFIDGQLRRIRDFPRSDKYRMQLLTGALGDSRNDKSLDMCRRQLQALRALLSNGAVVPQEAYVAQVVPLAKKLIARLPEWEQVQFQGYVRPSSAARPSSPKQLLP